MKCLPVIQTSYVRILIITTQFLRHLLINTNYKDLLKGIFNVVNCTIGRSMFIDNEEYKCLTKYNF